jgi:general secretion pathway protein M
MSQASAHHAGPAPLAALQARAQAWWQGLAERERLMLGAGAAVLGLFLLWALAVAPALRTLKTAPAELEQLEQQLQQMRRLAGETKELRALPALPAAQALPALKAATERLGDKARLQVQGDRAVLTLNGVSGPELRALLAETRGGARARATEAQLTRGALGYSGNLVLAIGGGGA